MELALTAHLTPSAYFKCQHYFWHWW